MSEAFEAEPGRLDAVVSAHLGVPRAEVQRAIVAGAVLVDGSPRRSARLAGGERIEVDLRRRRSSPPRGRRSISRGGTSTCSSCASPPAADPPDREPARRDRGQPPAGHGDPARAARRPAASGDRSSARCGTSGLLVVASDDETFEGLVAMFKRHEAGRAYLALVRGSSPRSVRGGCALGRAGARIRVDATGGREASTGFEVRDRFDRATLLEAEPRTGRTHQIRVHLSSIGHPILGDRRYGGGGEDARARARASVPARVADRVRPPDHGRADRPGGPTAARPAARAREGEERPG